MTAPPKSAADSDEPPAITPEASLAADDPTAVWDADTLREAGLDDLAARPEDADSPPATQGQNDASPSIVTPLASDEIEYDEDATEAWDEPPIPQVPQRPSARSAQGSGWGTTLLLALVLGSAVYFAVRFLR